MKRPPNFPVRLLARLFLGSVFVALGAAKAVDPVTFLKLVREFHVVESPPALNVVAAVLPWFEIICGALLIVGAKVRAAACLQALLLAGFTGLILTRGLAMHVATGVPLWRVRYDCGCGTGEVYVGAKLVENLGLITLAWFVASQRAFSAHQREQTRSQGDERSRRPT